MGQAEVCEVTVLMPCLDEGMTVGACVSMALAWLSASGVSGEVVVVDNGSRDNSVAEALAACARVVVEDRRGYGAALRRGLDESLGIFVVIGDADGSYDFTSISPMVEKLRAGADLVVGNRFVGGIQPGAMPWLHRRIGNPLLSWVGRRRCRIVIGDFHCGLRGVRRSSALTWDLCTDGMEFASELIVKAAVRGATIVEVPTQLARDGRSGIARSHLRPLRDGYRHLDLLLGRRSRMVPRQASRSVSAEAGNGVGASHRDVRRSKVVESSDPAALEINMNSSA